MAKNKEKSPTCLSIPVEIHAEEASFIIMTGISIDNEDPGSEFAVHRLKLSLLSEIGDPRSPWVFPFTAQAHLYNAFAAIVSI